MKRLFLIASACLLTTFACAGTYTAGRYAGDNFDSTESNDDENEYLESSLSDYDAIPSASEFNFDEYDTDLNESDMYVLDEEFAENNDSNDFEFNESEYEFPASDDHDYSAEAYLREALESNEYLNTLINYRYDNKTYPIRVIRNPNERVLFSELAYFVTPVISQTIVLGDLPNNLATHIREQFWDMFMFDGCDVDLKCHQSVAELYGDLHPVEIGVTVNAFDSNIRNFFHPNDKVKNEVFYYFLDDTYYKVRFIGNPKKELCKSFYSGYIEGKKRDFSLSWDEKYGIVTDFKVPQKYIDHWVKATEASWWDKHFNFQIENGTNCIYQEVEPGLFVITTTTYTLDRMFHVMRQLVVQR